MKKIWNFIDNCLGTFLAWFENKAFAFVFALLLAVAGFFGADPVSGVPMFNVCILAFLVGLLTTAVLLFGTSIVVKKGYNLPSLVYASFGAFFGVLLALLLDKLV